MSGVGKSTALAGLAARGFPVVDTDEPGWIEVVDGERLWHPARMIALLDEPRSGPVFVSGTVRNQGRFARRFDAVVLLTAPIEVLLERIRLRSTNDFGKREDERAAIVRDRAEVEPLLERTATHVIDATEPPGAVLDRLVAIAAG
ncbi:hypothetical protein D1781_06280 [Amnibacterium setariae]|uniref:ATP-binding protein n=2 Tax=Amnibacterium setariae TaxID=2306585 RepID=A0A3A1U7I2_9MICO|nr:hypothetical protein D1781_06280 [Amnibacterium setariae]